MTDLSPAAQAVLDAAYALPLKGGQPSIAAALRAAADLDETLLDGDDECLSPVRAVRTDQLLAIAAELEGAQ